MTNREIDIEVEHRIFGTPRGDIRKRETYMPHTLTIWNRIDKAGHMELPHFTEDPGAAASVIEEMMKRGHHCTMDGSVTHDDKRRWRVMFSSVSKPEMFSEHADTMAKAVCLAALAKD